MAKLYCPIRFQHQADDFWTIYKASVCAVERRRAQFFALRAEGLRHREPRRGSRWHLNEVWRLCCLNRVGVG